MNQDPARQNAAELENLPPVIREQIPLNQALASALIAALPPYWQAARLRLEWASYDEPPLVKISSVELRMEQPVTETLLRAAADFSAHRTRYRLPFRAAVLEVRASPARDWQMALSFE